MPRLAQNQYKFAVIEREDVRGSFYTTTTARRLMLNDVTVRSIGLPLVAVVTKDEQERAGSTKPGSDLTVTVLREKGRVVCSIDTATVRAIVSRA